MQGLETLLASRYPYEKVDPEGTQNSKVPEKW